MPHSVSYFHAHRDEQIETVWQHVIFCAGDTIVDTVGRNNKVIEKYMQNQLEEDFANDQISLKEYIDPFTGNKNK